MLPSDLGGDATALPAELNNLIPVKNDEIEN
jgi:hypothetical protein